MKRLITSLLSCSILLSAFSPCVFAESDMEKALSDIKLRAGITDEYTDFSRDYYEEENLTTYHLNWSTEENVYVNVSYNSDNIITSYNIYDKSERKDYNSLPDISAAEAKKSAQDFIDKLNPENKGEYIVTDSENANLVLGSDYSFYIERLKNGIKVNGNSGSINVNRDSGKIQSMYISYTHIDDFVDITKSITADEAKELYKNNLGSELVYLNYVKDKKQIMFPAYVEKESNKYINAVTGEVCEPTGLPITYRGKAESMFTNASAADTAAGGLTEVELEELEKISGLISKEDIEQQLRNNKLLNIDAPLNSISLSRDYYDSTSYRYTLFFSDDKTYTNITADAKTGELIHYSTTAENSEAADEEKVKAYTEEIFDTLASSKKSEYKFASINKNTAMYQRYVNGIKVQNDTITIHVDNTGKLLGYNLGYTNNVEFPPIDKAIDADEAADRMFEATAYDMVYYPTSGDDGKITAEAVYMTATQIRINPFTGKPVNYRNEEENTKQTVYAYTDISNHYARNQIETLAQYGIGFETEEFLPDAKITQRDFLSMVMPSADIYRKYNNDDEMYEAANDRGYITKDERNDSGEVTREFAAKVIIRVLGAESFAEYENIYITPFKDVTENKGYIALLSAMKIVNGDGKGNFNPKNSLTRAESACMIYNYLNR